MLDRLDLALQHYGRIRPGADEPLTGRKAEALSRWLEQDVCGLVEELVQRPDFRAQARWPLDRLQPESGSAERALVEAVDADLVACAGHMADAARQPALRDALLRLGPCHAPLPEGDPRGSTSTPCSAEGTPVPLGLREVEYLVSDARSYEG